MKKLSLILAISLAATGSAFAGGLNQAVVEEMVEQPTETARTGSAGWIVPLVLLGVVAAAASTTNGSN